MPRLLVEAAAGADGNPGRRVLVVRLAAVAGADGMVADRATFGKVLLALLVKS